MSFDPITTTELLDKLDKELNNTKEKIKVSCCGGLSIMMLTKGRSSINDIDLIFDNEEQENQVSLAAHKLFKKEPLINNEDWINGDAKLNNFYNKSEEVVYNGKNIQINSILPEELLLNVLVTPKNRQSIEDAKYLTLYLNKDNKESLLETLINIDSSYNKKSHQKSALEERLFAIWEYAYNEDKSEIPLVYPNSVLIEEPSSQYKKRKNKP